MPVGAPSSPPAGVSARVPALACWALAEAGEREAVG